jgi:outer membrane protein X
MKQKLFITLILFCFVAAVYAQEAGKIRGTGFIGIAAPPSGLGMSFNADLRYVVTDNANIGAMWGLAMMYRDFGYSFWGANASITMHFNRFFLVHGDYYFNDGSKMFAPFLGGGIGNFNVFNMNLYVEANQQPKYVQVSNPPEDRVIGGLIRGGFELGKFRVSLDYYLIPRSTMFNEDLLAIGKAGNSYLNMNLSFYLGGGKWRKYTPYR